jgi:carbamoyltransferase
MDRILGLTGPRAYTLDPTYFFYGPNDGNTYSKKLVQLFGPPRRGSNDHIDQHYKDIAYAVQTRLEAAILRLVQRVTDRAGLRDLCVSGGVGLNCVANGKIAASGLVDRLYVSPISNDAGSALGAAL